MAHKIFLPLFVSLCSMHANASESRSYPNAPKNTSTLETRVGYQTSDSSTTHAKMNFVAQRYLQYFEIDGHTAAAYIMTPYFDQNAHNNNKTLNVDQSGMGDTIVAFAYGISGMDAMDASTFKQANHNGLSTSCGVFLTLPTGSYDRTKLLNNGNNRYQTRMECNATLRDNAWYNEINTGAIHYTVNDEYILGRLSQKPLYFIEAHSSKNLTPRLWVGADAYLNIGGEKMINATSQKDRQRTLSLGLSTGFRITPQHALRATYQKSVDKLPNTPSTTSMTVLYNYIF